MTVHPAHGHGLLPRHAPHSSHAAPPPARHARLPTIERDVRCPVAAAELNGSVVVSVSALSQDLSRSWCELVRKWALSVRAGQGPFPDAMGRRHGTSLAMACGD